VSSGAKLEVTKLALVRFRGGDLWGMAAIGGIWVLLHPCAGSLVGYKPWHNETATSSTGTARSGFQRPAIHRRGDPMGGAMVSDVPDQLS
jgi:hypothetical protein